MKRFFASFSTLILLVSGTTFAQGIITSDTTLRIPGGSTLAFINFTPDARSGGLGEAGVALSPDANASYWNAAKLAFAEQEIGGSLSYTPWLRNLTDDMFLAYLTAYYKIAKDQALAFSLNYNNQGKIDLRDGLGNHLRDVNSTEFAVAGSYSRKLSENLSVGLTLKYINSNLGDAGTSFNLKPASTAAGDISVFYKKERRNESTGSNLTWALGGMISNLGGKVSYGGDYNYFIPTNLKLGTGVSISADGKNKFTVVLDFNKLMVPTPPIWRYENGQQVIVKGKDPSKTPLLSGIFGSFADAPDGASEELSEVTISSGVEYSYNDAFAARVGYFNESKQKGNRKYFTAGLGLRFQKKYSLDFAYLMPVTQGNPLAQTLRVTLSMHLFKKQNAFEEDER